MNCLLKNPCCLWVYDTSNLNMYVYMKDNKNSHNEIIIDTSIKVKFLVTFIGQLTSNLQ
jgi:hypothetical protein